MILDESAIDGATQELLIAAGRPELFIRELTDYELEAWRSITRRVVRAYLEALNEGNPQR